MSRKTKNVLFVCSPNKLRSPTAEQVFSAWEGLEPLSAGTNNDAFNPLDEEQIAWADIIFVMEKTHRSKVLRKYRKATNGNRVVCLDITGARYQSHEGIRSKSDAGPRYLDGGIHQSCDLRLIRPDLILQLDQTLRSWLIITS